MAANLSLVMDDTDKVRAAATTTRSRRASRSCRPTSTRRTTASSRSTRSASATGWAASRAPASRRSRRSSPRASAGGPFRDLFDFCRRVDKRARQPPRRRGADPRRRVRRDRPAARHALRVGRRRARRGRARRGGGGAGVAVRRGAARGRRSRSSPRASGRKPSGSTHEKAALGFYLSGHPYAAYAAELAPLVRQPLANLQPRREPVLIAGIVTALRVQTSRRGKMAFVTLDDGARHRRDRRVQRDLRRRAQPAARGPARHRRSEDHAADERRRPDAGPARRRRSGPRPRRDPQALREGRCASHATAAPRPSACSSCSRRFATAPARSSSSTATAASAASSSCPTRWRVNPDEPLIAQLRDWLAPENVRVVY